MTNNNILIGAEGLDGANFLCSCLTMSDKVYFNNCTLDEKIKFFFDGMNDIVEKNEVPIWSDVSMLFSGCARSKNKLSFSIYQSKNKISNDKTLISKTRLPMFWPLTIHMAKNPEDSLSKLFQSKYFIGLINPDLFICLRTILIHPDCMDNTIPYFNLFTISEFNCLSKEVQEKIKYNYQSESYRLFEYDSPFSHKERFLHKWQMSNMECHINDMNIIQNELQYLHFYRESNELLKTKVTHEWDCNWFLNEDEMVKNIKILYLEMNLGECDEKLIRKMYRVWIGRIEFIKKSQIEAFCSTSINNNMFTI